MNWEAVQIWIVLALLAWVIFAFIRERVQPDVVALVAMSVLLATGVLTSRDALAVFSNSGPITVAAMFVLSAALERTGTIERLGSFAISAAARAPTMALLGMIATVMLVSAFINNTPVVVILTPVAILLAKSLGLSASRLLMPLSFVSILGGTTTLIGSSTNILVSGVAVSYGQPAISMFEMTLPGLIMAMVGVIYLAIAGRWLLPDRPAATVEMPERSFLAEVVIPLDSGFVDKTLEQSGLTHENGVDIVDIVRNHNSLRWSVKNVKLQVGDRLVMRTNVGDVMGLREAGSVLFGTRDKHELEPLGAEQAIVMEGVVGPQSRLIGNRIADLNFRRRYGVYILAVHRQGGKLHQNFDELRLSFGDVLLLEGPPEGLTRLFERRALVNLNQPHERPFRRDKAPIAIAAILSVMGLAVFDLMPIESLAIIAATAVVALRCITPEEAYEAIQWRILMLIFGMLALGVAMEKTGAAALIVKNVVTLVHGLGPLAVLALIYLFTSALTEVISNNASAILITPITIGLAHELGVDPRPFIIAVMFAASASFATPIGYQTNTFVYSAGGYKFTDFLKIGLPLNLLIAAMAMLLIPVFWPF